jgi:hypothetical protein
MSGLATRRALLLGLTLLSVLAACGGPRLTSERHAAARQAAEDCRREGIVVDDYQIDQFGTVTVRSFSGHASAQDQANRLATCVRRKVGSGSGAPPVTVVPSTAPAPATTSTPIPSGTSRTAERLKELESLRQQQLISDTEYQAARKRILDGL